MASPPGNGKLALRGAETEALRARSAAVSRLTPAQVARAIEIGRSYLAEAGQFGDSAAAENDEAAP